MSDYFSPLPPALARIGNALSENYKDFEDFEKGFQDAPCSLDLDAIENAGDHMAHKCYGARLRNGEKAVYGVVGDECSKWRGYAGLTHTDDALLARAESSSYWRKKWKQATLRWWAHTLMKEGLNANYIADDVVNLVNEAQKRSNNLMAQMVATHEEMPTSANTMALQEAIDKSVSNPDIKMAELIVRMRGAQKYADEFGYICTFVTVTAPSRYHASKSSNPDIDNAPLESNPKYEDFTPRETSQYLGGVWSRVRAKFARDGLDYFGLRVAEPHRNGTPHHHYTIFHKKEDTYKMRGAFLEHGLKDSAGEYGSNHRIEFKAIDRSRGDVIAYLIKYLTKNINSRRAPRDLYGKVDYVQALKAVTAWAKVWGIRQFQSIGIQPVGVWRELRRASRDYCGRNARKIAGDKYRPLRQAMQASTDGDYYRYMKLMHRYSKKIRLLKETVKNKYDEDVTKTQGLLFKEAKPVQIITRFIKWVIGKAEDLLDEAELEAWQIQQTQAGMQAIAGVRPAVMQL